MWYLQLSLDSLENMLLELTAGTNANRLIKDTPEVLIKAEPACASRRKAALQREIKLFAVQRKDQRRTNKGAVTCRAVSCCLVARVTACVTAASSWDDNRLWPSRHCLLASGDADDPEDEDPAVRALFWGCTIDAELMASCCILASAKDLYLRTCRSQLSRSQVLCSETMTVSCLVASPSISPCRLRQ